MNIKNKIVAPIYIKMANSIECYNYLNKLKIRKITDGELKILFGISGAKFKKQDFRGGTNINNVDNFWSDIPSDKFLGLSDLLDCSIPYFVIEADDPIEIERVLYAIRLLKEENCFCPKGIKYISKGCTEYYFRPFNISYEKRLKLTKNDIVRLNKLLDVIKFEEGKSKIIYDRLKICLNIDLSKQVRFIEAVGVIESIILGNPKDELIFRFSLYSSYILNKYKIITSFTEMKNIYDIRSGLVHKGGCTKFNNEIFAKVIRYLKTIVILFYWENISNDSIKEDICKKLKINDEK